VVNVHGILEISAKVRNGSPCTFSSQQPTTITDEHLTELLVGSDHIWIHAYEGMTLDARHAWNKHTEVEIDAISVWSSLELASLFHAGMPRS
jgi:hypothetical protein